MSAPIIRYVDYGNGFQTLDEFIADDVKNVHLEQMGDCSWWIGITDSDGRLWHINVGALGERAKGFATVQDVTV